MSLRTVITALAITQAVPLYVSAMPSPQESSTQIIGGTLAKEGEFPYIVSLRSIYQDQEHFCGGSLLNSNTVITAAHCVYANRPDEIYIRAGSLSTISGGVFRNLSSITVHPNWDTMGIPWDYAILHLTTPLEESSTIGYVALPAADSDPEVGSPATTAGWGATDQEADLPPPTDLMRVTAPILDRSRCGANVAPQNICAGAEEGGLGACRGDSGGPVVDSNATLIGIVSFGGPICATAARPSVSAKVSSALDFIYANL